MQGSKLTGSTGFDYNKGDVWRSAPGSRPDMVVFKCGFTELAIKLHIDNQRFKTENCWSSVHTHFQDGARTVQLLLLPPKAADTSFIAVCTQSPLR